MNEKICVVMCKAGENATIEYINNDLESMQKIVGGYVEYYHLDSEVAIICNDEGKINGLPLNRSIKDEHDEIIEIIAGNFFICSAPDDSDEFGSLSEKQLKKCMEKFKYSEDFLKINGEIKAIPNKKESDRNNDLSR